MARNVEPILIRPGVYQGPGATLQVIQHTTRGNHIEVDLHNGVVLVWRFTAEGKFDGLAARTSPPSSKRVNDQNNGGTK